MPTQQYWYPQNGYCTTSATTTNIYVPAHWNTTSAAITVASPNTTWSNWNNQWYQTSISPNQTIWQNWINTTITTTGNSGYATFRQETPEEIEANRERRQQEQRERVAARAKARTLLEGFLDDEQKVELEHHGRFHVRGSRGRRYCIRAEGQSGNVDLLKEDGSVQARLCCHPRGYVPDGDAWLMQMIEIRHDEDHFLRTANVHRGALPAAV